MDSGQPTLSLRPRLVALHGPDECGKDTIAEIIREQVEGSQMTITVNAFADRVKIAIGACFGIPEDKAIAWYDQVKAGSIEVHWESGTRHWRLDGRKFIEHFAESHKKLFGETFWVDQVLPESRVDFLRLYRFRTAVQVVPDIVLVTDLRYEVEHERLEDLGGEVWGIIGRGVEGNAHEIPPKYVISNHGSIDDLRPQIATLLASP